MNNLSDNQKKLNEQVLNCLQNEKLSYEIKLKKIKYLLRLGAMVNYQGGYGNRSILHLAVINGETEIVKFLIEKGANIEAQDDKKRTPLMYAVYHKHN